MVMHSTPKIRKIPEKVVKRVPKKRKESRVAKKMKELTSRKLVILMLLMLLFVPLMDLENFTSFDEDQLFYLANVISPMFQSYQNDTVKDE